MRIGNRDIGPGHPVYIIAELGVNHDGSPARALELVDAAHSAGADAIKLQYFETDRLMSKSAKLAAYQKAAGETDPITMLRRLELRIDDMGPIVERAHALGMHAIVTVFSTELVDLAERLPWDGYKSASPDIVHQPLLERLARTGKPLIISTGAATIDEVSRAAGWLHEWRAYQRTAVLQCVSSYPTSEGNAELGGIAAIAAVFDGPVGYSDHTPGEATGAAAVQAGACLLEKHLTYSRAAQGPDHSASLEPANLKTYTRLAHAAETRVVAQCAVEQVTLSIGSGSPGGAQVSCRGRKPTESATPSPEPRRGDTPLAVKRVLPIEQDVRRVSRQSCVALRPLPANHTITASDLTIKRPGTGFLPFELPSVIGRRVVRPIDADTVIAREDIA
jgi:sialic acid synthase SpsE